MTIYLTSTKLLIFIIFFLIFSIKARVTVNDWKNRTIYQILTDRFSRTDNSTEACNDLGKYCGGTYQGIS